MTRGKMFGLLGLAAVLTLSTIAVTPANAAVTLIDRNSVVTIDPNSSNGMYSWVVDGAQHMNRQWFWYRLGKTGAEASVDKLNLTFLKSSDGNEDPNNERLVMKYTDPNGKFVMEIDYVLTGGDPGSRTADIAETITIKNRSTEKLDFHFFQYCDFNLNGDGNSDSVTITGGNTAIQTGLSSSTSETIVASSPSLVETSLVPTLLNSLNDPLSPTTLSGITSAGPGDVCWAFQWDFDIAPGMTVMISKDKLITPEPGTLALIVLGGTMMLARRRRRTA